MSSTLDRYLAFRRSLGARPALEPLTVRARGLDFAVYRTPAVAGTPPLVCINGGLLFDHTLLWPALAALATDRQLIFFDRRGRGRSGSPPGVQAARIEFDAGDVPALRRALGIPAWDVLGHSWGGGIAMLATAQDLASTRKLVLVNAVGVTSAWLPPLHKAGVARLEGSAQERLAAFDPASLTTPDLDAHARYTQAFFPAWFADQQFAASVTPPKGTSVTGAVVAARLRREGYDWGDALRDLPTPTLVVHGAADVLPLAEASRTAAHLGHARLLPVAEAGHNPFWEAPVAFFAAVQTFLAEGSPDS
ncbi:alpha/beta fold hydrolase [Gemmatimonas groenlandica]|uniref:Alpha/beta hydrolase n=1 Tax=Gemmatimonas groenlandica TaxID=2732249 RepID=A0A6M4IW32_9BACT|nr:alpha/beta hydrolase [Gemmatimonas groenlandica]QJR37807.1 alpha/beta hydrolase [Gemmatimonas groenlandica]